MLLLQQQAALPQAPWLVLIPACAALAAWRRLLLVPAAFAVGFLWAAGAAHLRLAERLAPELEGRDLEVAGVVSSLPAATERGVRFEFDIEARSPGLPRRVLLSWYRTPLADEAPALLAGAVHPGERWLFTVRLRQPHGQLNPHGFDYEAWLTERGIGATGYVRSRGAQRLLGRRDSLADRIEQRARSGARPLQARAGRNALGGHPRRARGGRPARHLQRGVAPVQPHRRHAPDEHLRSARDARLGPVRVARLRRCGGACRGSRFALPARKAGALAAIAAALAYTLLAGFAVPAQRTFYMVTVVALALWSGRIASPARTLALALAVVTALDPWAVLQAGFWLSFGAVALIFYVSAGWTGREPRALQWLRVQWAITVGLAPAALFLFSQVSVVGPLANAAAIPLVSAVITPLALAAAVLPADALAAPGGMAHAVAARVSRLVRATAGWRPGSSTRRRSGRRCSRSRASRGCSCRAAFPGVRSAPR